MHSVRVHIGLTRATSVLQLANSSDHNNSMPETGCWKQGFCIGYLHGQCTKGSVCSFAHPPLETAVPSECCEVFTLSGFGTFDYRCQDIQPSGPGSPNGSCNSSQSPRIPSKPCSPTDGFPADRNPTTKPQQASQQGRAPQVSDGLDVKPFGQTTKRQPTTHGLAEGNNKPSLNDGNSPQHLIDLTRWPTSEPLIGVGGALAVDSRSKV